MSTQFQARGFRQWQNFVLFQQHKETADRYLKCKGGSSVTKMLQNWNKRQLVRAWRNWIQVVSRELSQEIVASVIEIQCQARRFLVKCRSYHTSRRRAAVHIQCLARRRAARVEWTRRKRHAERDQAARVLQLSYRGFNGRQVARALAQSLARHGAARKIQRRFRRSTFHSVVNQVMQEARRVRAAVKIQAQVCICVFT